MKKIKRTKEWLAGYRAAMRDVIRRKLAAKRKSK
jgi:hypothetical protein